jgi:hypothetical protein
MRLSYRKSSKEPRFAFGLTTGINLFGGLALAANYHVDT